MCSKQQPFHTLLPLLRNMVPQCPLMTGIVASQYPSSRDTVLVRRCLTPLISACLNAVKATLPQLNTFTTNLRTWMKVVTFLLTAMIGGIFHKQCQWLAWRVWWHAMAFVTQEITWRRAYVLSSLIKPTARAAQSGGLGGLVLHRPNLRTQ